MKIVFRNAVYNKRKYVKLDNVWYVIELVKERFNEIAIISTV